MLKKRYIKFIPWLVLLTALISTALFSYRYYALVKSDRQSRFNSISNEVRAAVRDRLYDYMNGLYGGVGLFDASEYVSRAEWLNYVNSTRLEQRFPGILGMGYIEVVQHQDLKRFIKQAHSEGEVTFTVRPPGVRPYYYLVKYVEPNELNKTLVGFDMNTEDVRHIALVAARDHGRPALTTRIFLDDVAKGTPGFLLIVPFYSNTRDVTRAPVTIAERAMKIQGWVFGRFVAKEFFEGLLGSKLREVAPYFYLTVNSKSIGGEDEFLFSSKEILPSKYARKGLSKKFTIDFFGTQWTVEINATSEFFESTEILDPIWILVIGILLSLFLFGFVYTLSYTQFHAMKLANNMTIELREKLIELERANRELHELLFIASHDLRKPLQDMYETTEKIELSLKEKLSPDLKKNIEVLRKRIDRVFSSLDKLIEYSRIKTVAKQLPIEKVDTRQLIKTVFSELSNPNNVQLKLSEHKFPIIWTHEFLLRSVLERLIDNALRYSRESGGELSVLVVEDAGFAIFELKDNGVGIGENQMAELFELDKTFGVSDGEEKMGMGLVLSKKIVDTYGGVIKLVSNEFCGVSCYFTWPVETDPKLFS